MRRYRPQQGRGEIPGTKFPTRINDPGSGLFPQWINGYTASLYPFVIGLASQQIIPANPLRAYLLIQNKDAAADMLINFGSEATAFSSVIIIPRGNYELIGGAYGGSFVPGDSVHVLGTAAGMQGALIEGVLPPLLTER